LRDIAYEMRKQLRSFELLYRMGGEEFVLILPGAPQEDARELGERLRSSLRACRPGGLDITVSIGISTGSGADVVFDPLFRDADKALYAAKARGRDRVTCFDEIRTRQPDDWVDVPSRLTPV
jgi:diguanylate cyclase (GGDEF)-like protein